MPHPEAPQSLSEKELRRKCQTIQQLFGDISNTMDQMEFHAPPSSVQELRAMRRRTEHLYNRFVSWTMSTSLSVRQSDES